jgi:hypothetical protein
VTVPQWPEPITPENVVDVTLRDAYARFADRDERAAFLGDVARAVWNAATSTTLGSPEDIGAALGDAAADRHLMLWLARPGEQRVADAIGASGRVGDPRGDSLLVVSQNASGNKVDYYLDRTMSYDVTVRPDRSGRRATAEGKVVVALQNSAPATGLSQEVIGPYDARFEPGENRAFVSVYTEGTFAQATLDDRPRSLESASELGRRVYSTFVSVPAGQTRTLTLDTTKRVPLVDGWYRLDVLKQATLRPERLEISVRVPSGWRIVDTIGVTVDDHDPRRATVRRSVTSDFTLGVQVARTEGPSLLDRLRAGR